GGGGQRAPALRALRSRVQRTPDDDPARDRRAGAVADNVKGGDRPGVERAGCPENRSGRPQGGPCLSHEKGTDAAGGESQTETCAAGGSSRPTFPHPTRDSRFGGRHCVHGRSSRTWGGKTSKSNGLNQ